MLKLKGNIPNTHYLMYFLLHSTTVFFFQYLEQTFNTCLEVKGLENREAGRPTWIAHNSAISLMGESNLNVAGENEKPS